MVRGCASLVVALAALGLLVASAASAETCSASSTAEFAACVTKTNAAVGASTIVLAGGIYQPEKTVSFTNTSGTVTVEGPAGSPNVLGRSAELTGEVVEPFPSELFVVNSGASVTFKHVEIIHGGGSGVPATKVNAEPEGGSPKIGKITLEDSLVGGNIGTGVTLTAGAEAVVRNSTLSDNLGFAFVDGGTASFFNSTVAFNKGGGLQLTGTSLNLTNTIVAENKGSGDCKGKATASDHSLDSDGTCGVGALSKTNPMLQTALANNGGTTGLHSLTPGSPAISAGDEGMCTSEDQRGAPRPGIAGKPCSIGADEYSNVPPRIIVPTEVSVETTNPEGEIVTYQTEATGSGDLVTSFECTPASGTKFSPGTTTVTCNAEDGHENKATATFNVKVAETTAATPPTAVTGKASSITETGATLNATVNPNGTAVTACTFEYASGAFFEISQTYEMTAPCATLPGSGTSPVAVSAAIGALSPGTTYHFRIVAENAATTTKGEGADETFETTKSVVVTGPPTAVTGKASSITETGATLNATVNPNGTTVSNCTFEYGENLPYEKTAPCATLPGSGTSPVAVSAAIGALSPGTTYHFRIVAENAATTTKGEGADETFETTKSVVVTGPPTAVTGKASSITETGATLNATVNPNGTTVSNCTFEYGENLPYEKTAPCATLPGSGTSPVAVSAAIGALSPGTTYHFRIVAENAATTTKGEGADETFETTKSVVVTGPPTAVTGKASSITETGATLNATVNPNGTTVSNCTFEYGENLPYEKTAPCATLPGSGTSPVAVSAAIGALSPGTTYHFRIVAENAATTTKGEGADETFETTKSVVVTGPPTAVTGKASSITETGATLNATVNPNGTTVSNCTFEYGENLPYEKTAPCATLPGSGTSPVAVSAAIGALSPGTTYHFRIVAENAATTTKGEGADEMFETTKSSTATPSAEEQLRQLLEEVKSASLSRSIRSDLVDPLKEALRELSSPRDCERWDGRHGRDERDRTCVLREVRDDLQQFIGVINADQRRRRPQIPAASATAWIAAAQHIEASLEAASVGGGSDDGCGGDPHDHR